MVNPKKDYELLMRYLQGDALKHQPDVAPEQTYAEPWQPPAQAAPVLPPVQKETKAPTRTSWAVINKRRWQWPGFKSLPRLRPLRITTAVFAVLLLAILIWKGYSLYRLSADEIYDKIYVPYSVPKDAETAPQAKYGIGQYYTDGNYVAVTMLSKKQPQLSDKERLLTGLAYMHRGDYARAVKWLEPAAGNFKSPYRQQAGFYLALAYLKNEDYDRSIEKMQQILYTADHPYHDRITPKMIRDIKVLKWR